MIFRMRITIARFVFLLVVTATFQSSSSIANPRENSHQFHLRKIKRIEAAYFGANRLYFNLACNEDFRSVLTQKEESGALQIGILTETHPSNCSKPPRETFVRTQTGSSALHPVTAFNEVWQCAGTCYIISDPEMSPYRPVEVFGTSEKQAREKIPCQPAYQIDMACDAIEVY